VNDPIWIKKDLHSIGKIEPSIVKAGVAFAFIPFEYHDFNVVLWTTKGKIPPPAGEKKGDSTP